MKTMFAGCQNVIGNIGFENNIKKGCYKIIFIVSRFEFEIYFSFPSRFKDNLLTENIRFVMIDSSGNLFQKWFHVYCIQIA